MATKQFYAARDFKYGTRMLRAGDPVEMTAPHARLYTALNAITTAKPKQKEVRSPEHLQPAAETSAEAPARPKRATRKRAAKK